MQGIILVNGYPGVGKLNICRELHQILPNSKLFGNHNLIDTVASLFERDHPLYYTFRNALRQTVFTTLIQSHSHPLSQQHQITYPIFTEAQGDDSIGTSVIHEYLTFAQALNIPLYSITLTCSEEENARRLVSREISGGSTKLLDTGILHAIRASEGIYQFEKGRKGVEGFEIDVEGLSPDIVAGLIVERFEFINRNEPERRGEEPVPTPYPQPGPNRMADEQAKPAVSSATPTAKPLAIGATPHNPPNPKPEVQTLDVGGGNIVKLDALGPMIINSDGTLSRIQNWQDLHPIEQERTVRLLVKKRNLVRLQKLEAEDNVQAEEKLGLSTAT